MNKKIDALLDENEYKEECIFTSIDIFNGSYNYLNFYYICEIIFNDFSFISPYHCYFFLRNQYEDLKYIENNFMQDANSSAEDNPLKIINEKKVIELFQNESIIYYNEGELTDLKRKTFENIIDIINRLTVSDLIEISLYFNENPHWQKNKLMWMDMIQRDKFRRYERIRENLKETGKREIIYKVNDEEIGEIKNKNMIRDFFFFGVFENRGQNYLGRIYMNIRNDILKNYEIYTWLLTNCNMQTDENLLADIYIEEKYLEKTLIDETVLYNDKLIEKTKKEVSDNLNYTNDCFSVEEKVKNYTFEKKEYISFGKNENNDVICLNPSISRFHCVLYACKDHHVYLIDVGSKARTKLNNNVCEIHKKYKIANNDIISLGVSKRTYKININVEKVLSYLDKKQNEINKKMKIMNEEIENPLSKDLLKLKISNIYYKCNENDILDFFKDCGQIKKIQMFNVNFKKHSNNSKNPKFLKEALIEVYNEETSSNIMQKNECFLYGRKINITYLSVRNKTNNSNFKKNENSDIQIICKNEKYNGEKITISTERYYRKNKDKKIYEEKNDDKKMNREKNRQYEKYRSGSDKYEKRKNEKCYGRYKMKNNKIYKKRSISTITLSVKSKSKSRTISESINESRSENSSNFQKYKKKHTDKTNKNIKANRKRKNKYKSSSSINDSSGESDSTYEQNLSNRKKIKKTTKCKEMS